MPPKVFETKADARAAESAEQKVMAPAAGKVAPPPAATGPVTGTDAVTIATLREGVGKTFKDNPSLQRALLVALDEADSLATARANVEAWFDSSMDRVSGWYKRRTQYWLIIIGVVTAVAMNIDSVRVINALSTNDTLRKAVVAQAEAAAKIEHPTPDNKVDFAKVKANVEGLGLPIGWDEELATALCLRQQKLPDAASVKPDAASVKTAYAKPAVATTDAWIDHPEVGAGVVVEAAPRHWIGWLATAFAISFGAPFWFDVLNRIMVVRSTVKPGEKSGDAPEKDPVRKIAAA